MDVFITDSPFPMSHDVCMFLISGEGQSLFVSNSTKELVKTST